MKKLLLALLLGFAGITQSLAVEDIRVSVTGTNVVLSWPSLGYESFVVRYRTNFNAESPWVVLTNMVATSGTNRTALTHKGAAVMIPCDDSGGGGGGNPPNPQAMMSGESDDFSGKLKKPKKVDDGIPPLPEPLWPTLSVKERQRQEDMAAAGEAQMSLMSLTESAPCGLSTGFYQVILVPDTWYDYSTYIFDYSPEFIPIYTGIDGDNIADAQLLMNGQPTETEFVLEEYDFGTPQNPDVALTYGFWFYHDRLTNGTYQLQVQTKLNPGRDVTLGTNLVTLTAPSVTVGLANPIRFSSANEIIVGTSHVYTATTTISPATWLLEIYDANNDLIRTATGSVSGGNVSWTWDLKDSGGNLRNSLTYDPYFFFDLTVTPTNPLLSSQARTRSQTTTLDYPDVGGWVIAYQDKDQNLAAAREKIYEAAMNVRGGPALQSIANEFILLRYEKTVHTNAQTAQTIRNNSWATLVGHLFNRNNRNFYYLGHGSGNLIGGDFDIVSPNGSILGSTLNSPSRARLTSTEVISNITSNKYAGARPYRFVFLDGCSTATGNWPDAFGIAKTTNSLAFYQNSNRKPRTRPATFVGWSEITKYSQVLGSPSGEWGDYQQYANFRTEWMFNWVSNPQTDQLTEALTLARQNSGWISQQTYQRILRVFGYQDLGFNEYNTKSSWQ